MSATAPKDLTGARVGRYVLKRRLNSHETEALYLASADGETDPCLVRQLGRYEHHTRSHWEELMREAQLAKQMNHPHLLRVLDFGQFEGECFLATEHVDGLSLHAVLAHLLDSQSHLELTEVLPLGIALADVLGYLQARASGESTPRLTHGRISPTQIYLPETGIPKLGGFGHRSPVEHGYQAPELLMGLPADGRADVFSLGVVLMELLIGRRLFDRPDAASTISAVLGGADIPPLEHVDPDLRPRVDELFQRALARDREQRHPTGKVLSAELARIATTLDIDPPARLAGVVRRVRGDEAPDLLDIVPARPVAAAPAPPPRSESSSLPENSAIREAPPTNVEPVFAEPPPRESGFALVASVAAATTAIVGTLVFLGLQLASGAPP